MTVSPKTSRRDRWADWAVIALVVVALLMGLWLRRSTLYRTEDFTWGDAGIAGRVFAGWVRQTGTDPLLSARNPLSGSFNTVLELRSRALAAEADPTLALDALTLERAATVDAYKTLSTAEVVVRGETAVQRTFTYVLVDHHPYVDRLPEVVRGVDVALRDEGRVIVVTYLAGSETFDADYRYFRTFIESLRY
ncbi:MAG TPA: hypothetical protein PLH19_02495 [Anaerolineae bacterium]|nr:hypothetical protein [Anaerolineae bacterium]HQH37390.1 hypothetical protein [Anaerolineae bacterium]